MIAVPTWGRKVPRGATRSFSKRARNSTNSTVREPRLGIARVQRARRRSKASLSRVAVDGRLSRIFLSLSLFCHSRYYNHVLSGSTCGTRTNYTASMILQRASVLAVACCAALLHTRSLILHARVIAPGENKKSIVAGDKANDSDVVASGVLISPHAH